MHELVWVMSAGKPIPEGFRVEHVNGFKLDNTGANLHLVPCEPGKEYMGDKEATNREALGRIKYRQ